MSSTVDELTINFEKEGVLVIKELDKVILSKGAWATVLFMHQDWDARKNTYGPAKFTIRRYKKQNNEYKMRSKFTISSRDQAEKIISALQNWFQSPLVESSAGEAIDESDE